MAQSAALEPSNSGGLSSAANVLVEKLLTFGIDGAGPFKSAEEVAEAHLLSAVDVGQAVDRLIGTHVRLAAASGFVTGLGGFATMPVTIPAGLGGLLIVSTRMVAGIAHVRGLDLDSDEVRSVVLLTQIGSAGAEVLKDLGIKGGQKFLLTGVQKVPGPLLVKIQQRVGVRMLTRVGAKAPVNISRAVPLIGGGVGATVDGLTCRSIGAYAKKTLVAPPKSPDTATGSEQYEETR